MRLDRINLNSSNSVKTLHMITQFFLTAVCRLSTDNMEPFRCLRINKVFCVEERWFEYSSIELPIEYFLFGPENFRYFASAF